MHRFGAGAGSSARCGCAALEPAGGHRVYLSYPEVALWIHDRLGTPAMDAAGIRLLPGIKASDWCDPHGIVLERAMGTEHHQRGATLLDLGLRPQSTEALAVLKPEEKGSPHFTIEGWLDLIEGKRSAPASG